MTTLDDLLNEYFRQAYVKKGEFEECGHVVYLPKGGLVIRYDGNPVNGVEVYNDPDPKKWCANIRINISDDRSSYYSVPSYSVVKNLEVFELVKIY